ncbi:hypothetical protein SMICM17S_06204 [Streptomyces microflavus]
MPPRIPRLDEVSVVPQTSSRPAAGAPTVLKVVIAGGFGIGKTTAVGAAARSHR